MNKKLFVRIIADILAFIAVIYGQWMIALIILVICSWNYAFYYELIFAGLMYDSLFGLIPRMGIFQYVGIIVSVILYTIIIITKNIVRRQ